MNFETNSLGIPSGILMTMSKIPALSQKVLAEWLRMPERQELFPGLNLGPAKDLVRNPFLFADPCLPVCRSVPDLEIILAFLAA